MAERAGAKRVIAVEKDEEMAEIAKANFRRNKLRNTTLLVADVFTLDKNALPKIDVVFAEMLSTWCVVEPQVAVFNHVIELLGGNLITIPSRVINKVEGVCAKFGDSRGLVEIPTVFFEFYSTRPQAERLTRSTRVSEIDFSKKQQASFETELTLDTVNYGMMNALRLSSIVETCPGVGFGPTDDTMPNMVIPLPRSVWSNAGVWTNEDGIRVGIRYTYGAGWKNFFAEVI